MHNKTVDLIKKGGCFMGRSYRTPKNWSTAFREKLGVIYSCSNCNNQNDKPLFNSQNQPYCSNCLVKYGVVRIMKKRTAFSHYIGRPMRY